MFWKTIGVFCLILIDSGQFAFLHNSTTIKEVFNKRRFSKRLNDSIFDSNSGNKAFLKTRLLENLNNFYPSLSTNEQLEILSGTPKQNDNIEDFSNSVTESTMNQNYPTLLPNDPMNDPLTELEMATAPFTKIRTEGRIKPSNLDSIDTIRDWRKRLYRAFKNRSKVNRIIKSPTEEVVEMNDISPIVMDKNRQILLSRKEPNWQSVFGNKNIQTYGRDANGKLIPLFGLDANLLQQQLQSSQTPVEPYPPREIRFAYRTSNGQSVVYIPSSSSSSSSGRSLPDIVPVPVSSYLVTATAPPYPSAPPIQLHLLPSVTQQPPQQVQLIFPPAPTRTNNNEYFGQAFQTTLPSYSTFAPKDYDDRDLPNNNCGSCTGGNVQQNGITTDTAMDEKCNSLRLRNIIMNNIVQGDAESSKRAVQSAAEAEIGNFFDAICGTGFFSYIAHTDEFCLASSGGVNCYVFAPVCGTSAGGQDNMKTKLKSHLNKN